METERDFDTALTCPQCGAFVLDLTYALHLLEDERLESERVADELKRAKGEREDHEHIHRGSDAGGVDDDGFFPAGAIITVIAVFGAVVTLALGLGYIVAWIIRMTF